MKKQFHRYECSTGCGHTTIVDKFYKNKIMHCAVCGEKKTLFYKGKVEVKDVNVLWVAK